MISHWPQCRFSVRVVCIACVIAIVGCSPEPISTTVETTSTPALVNASPSTRAATVIPSSVNPSELTSTPIAAPFALGFRLIAHHNLNNRGANGGLALAGHCAYVGSRGGESAVAVVDVADPARPALAGKLSFTGTPTELRAVNDLALLIVTTSSPNALHTFDIRDCLHPARLGEVALPSAPHEFFLWRDPRQRTRVLAYVAMFSSHDGLHMVDVSDPKKPRLLLAWSVPGLSGLLHSIALSDDGRRAYISGWSGGFLLADTSELAEAKANPQIRLIGKLGYAANTTHSAVRVPGRALVILTDEIYSCPFGWLRVVDVANESRPKVAGEFRLSENTTNPCAAGTFTAHNPLPFHDLVMLTWYNGGVIALDIADATHPRLAAQYRVEGERFWSYPLVQNGLIYVASIEGGLYVLAYEGAHAEQVRSVTLAEGNANDQ